jgi:outer membrane biosynthesis protein TonB
MTSSDFQRLTPDQRGALADYRAKCEALATSVGSMRSNLRAQAKRRYTALIETHGLTTDQVDSYMKGAKTTDVPVVTNGRTGQPVKPVKPVKPVQSTTPEENPVPEIETPVEMPVEANQPVENNQSAETPEAEQPVQEPEATKPEFNQHNPFSRHLAKLAIEQGKALAKEITIEWIEATGRESVDAGHVQNYGPNGRFNFPSAAWVQDTRKAFRALTATTETTDQS